MSEISFNLTHLFWAVIIYTYFGISHILYRAHDGYMTLIACEWFKVLRY